MGKTQSPVARFYGLEEAHKVMPSLPQSPAAGKEWKSLPKKLTKVAVGTPAPKKRKVIL